MPLLAGIEKDDTKKAIFLAMVNSPSALGYPWQGEIGGARSLIDLQDNPIVVYTGTIEASFAKVRDAGITIRSHSTLTPGAVSLVGQRTSAGVATVICASDSIVGTAITISKSRWKGTTASVQVGWNPIPNLIALYDTSGSPWFETVDQPIESELGMKLRKIRERIVASGAKLLDWEEGEEEAHKRRGERI